MNLLQHGLIAAVLLPVMVGCGSSKQLVANRRSAQEAFDDGVVSFANKEYALAKGHFDEALETPGLYPDLITEASVKRAVSAAALGDIPAAHAGLDEVARDAPDLEWVYAARSYVLAKEGRKKESKAAWVKARRINRAVQRFVD